MGDQAIDAVRALARILDEQDRAREVRQERRSQQAREDFEVAAQQGSLHAAGDHFVQVGEHHARRRLLEQPEQRLLIGRGQSPPSWVSTGP